MFDVDYTKCDIIVNTCCEHIWLKDWIKLIPKDKILALQSTNSKYYDHINPAKDMEHFKDEAKLSKMFFKGTYDRGFGDDVKRFMIMGKK